MFMTAFSTSYSSAAHDATVVREQGANTGADSDETA
jgi:hypothetical protein